MKKKFLSKLNKRFDLITENEQKKKILTFLCLLIVAIICLSTSQIFRYLSLTKKLIGEADAMTLIIIKNDSFFNISSILLIIGLILTVIILLLFIKYIINKNERN